MKQQPPITTRTNTLVTHTSLFRSPDGDANQAVEKALADGAEGDELAALQQTVADNIQVEAPDDQTVVIHLNRTSPTDRKSTRLIQSLMRISYAVFCLKTKKTTLTLLNHPVTIIYITIIKLNM